MNHYKNSVKVTVKILMLNNVELIREVDVLPGTSETEIIDKLLETIVFDGGDGTFYPKSSVVSYSLK